MISSNKISGKIINYNETYSGEIIFDENIININNKEDINSENYIVPGFVDLHCHGGGGFDTMDGIEAIQKMSKYHGSSQRPGTSGTTGAVPAGVQNPEILATSATTSAGMVLWQPLTCSLKSSAGDVWFLPIPRGTLPAIVLKMPITNPPDHAEEI